MSDGTAKRPSEMTNDEIRVELSTIAIELADHRRDESWPGALIERRQALRHEVTSRPPNPAEVETLERELVGMRQRLETIQNNRPDVSGAGDGGQSAGSGIAEAQEMAHEYDRTSGARSLAERIAFVEARIAAARRG